MDHSGSSTMEVGEVRKRPVGGSSGVIMEAEASGGSLEAMEGTNAIIPRDETALLANNGLAHHQKPDEAHEAMEERETVKRNEISTKPLMAQDDSLVTRKNDEAALPSSALFTMVGASLEKMEEQVSSDDVGYASERTPSPGDEPKGRVQGTGKAPERREMGTQTHAVCKCFDGSLDVPSSPAVTPSTTKSPDGDERRDVSDENLSKRREDASPAPLVGIDETSIEERRLKIVDPRTVEEVKKEIEDNDDTTPDEKKIGEAVSVEKKKEEIQDGSALEQRRIKEEPLEEHADEMATGVKEKKVLSTKPTADNARAPTESAESTVSSIEAHANDPVGGIGKQIDPQTKAIKTEEGLAGNRLMVKNEMLEDDDAFRNEKKTADAPSEKMTNESVPKMRVVKEEPVEPKEVTTAVQVKIETESSLNPADVAELAVKEKKDGGGKVKVEVAEGSPNPVVVAEEAVKEKTDDAAIGGRVKTEVESVEDEALPKEGGSLKPADVTKEATEKMSDDATTGGRVKTEVDNDEDEDRPGLNDDDDDLFSTCAQYDGRGYFRDSPGPFNDEDDNETTVAVFEDMGNRDQIRVLGEAKSEYFQQHAKSTTSKGNDDVKIIGMSKGTAEKKVNVKVEGSRELREVNPIDGAVVEISDDSESEKKKKKKSKRMKSKKSTNDRQAEKELKELLEDPASKDVAAGSRRSSRAAAEAARRKLAVEMEDLGMEEERLKKGGVNRAPALKRAYIDDSEEDEAGEQSAFDDDNAEKDFEQEGEEEEETDDEELLAAVDAISGMEKYSEKRKARIEEEDDDDFSDMEDNESEKESDTDGEDIDKSDGDDQDEEGNGQEDVERDEEGEAERVGEEDGVRVEHDDEDEEGEDEQEQESEEEEEEEDDRTDDLLAVADKMFGKAKRTKSKKRKRASAASKASKRNLRSTKQSKKKDPSSSRRKSAAATDESPESSKTKRTLRKEQKKASRLVKHTPTVNPDFLRKYIRNKPTESSPSAKQGEVSSSNPEVHPEPLYTAADPLVKYMRTDEKRKKKTSSKGAAVDAAATISGQGSSSKDSTTTPTTPVPKPVTPAQAVSKVRTIQPSTTPSTIQLKPFTSQTTPATTVAKTASSSTPQSTASSSKKRSLTDIPTTPSSEVSICSRLIWKDWEKMKKVKNNGEVVTKIAIEARIFTPKKCMQRPSYDLPIVGCPLVAEMNDTVNPRIVMHPATVAGFLHTGKISGDIYFSVDDSWKDPTALIVVYYFNATGDNSSWLNDGFFTVEVKKGEENRVEFEYNTDQSVYLKKNEKGDVVPNSYLQQETFHFAAIVIGKGVMLRSKEQTIRIQDDDTPEKKRKRSITSLLKMDEHISLALQESNEDSRVQKASDSQVALTSDCDLLNDRAMEELFDGAKVDDVMVTAVETNDGVVDDESEAGDVSDDEDGGYATSEEYQRETGENDDNDLDIGNLCDIEQEMEAEVEVEVLGRSTTVNKKRKRVLEQPQLEAKRQRLVEDATSEAITAIEKISID